LIVEEGRSLGTAARRKAGPTLSLQTFAGRNADVFRTALRGRR
jgi:hypothetical protein